MTNIDTLKATSPAAAKILLELRTSLARVNGNRDLTMQAKSRMLAEAREKSQTALRDLRDGAQAAYMVESQRLRQQAEAAIPTPSGVEAVTAELRATRAWNRAKDRLDAAPASDRVAMAARIIADAPDVATVQVLREELGAYFETRHIPANTAQSMLDRRVGQLVPALGEADQAQRNLNYAFFGVLTPDLGMADEESRGGVQVLGLHVWPEAHGAPVERLPIEEKKMQGTAA